MIDVPIFVQGNTKPDITAILHDQDDDSAVVDLTDASVKFQMRQKDNRRFVVDAPATIVGDPTTGTVSYSWGPNDLNTPGLYESQWEVTYGDGKVQTTAHYNLIEVRRQ